MSTQLAIRLPDDLLRDLDWVVLRLNYDSRTDAMRDALVRLIDQERRRQIDEQYIEAYTRMPQTDDEIESAYDSLRQTIEEEPWDKWW
jgi:metal-responsive CopG/Arc/MetJ family transcriptional regulator